MENSGIFETVRVEKGKAILLSYHYERIRESSRKLLIPFSLSEEKFESLIVENSSFEVSLVRFTLSFNGSFTISSRPCEKREKVSILPLPFPKRTYDPLSIHKTTDVAKNLFALKYSQRKGFDEALLFSKSGFISETAFANIFFIKGGILFTPSIKTGCLPGTRRRFFLEKAKEFGMEVVEGFFTLKELLESDEVFITSAREDGVLVEAIGKRKLRKVKGKPFVERFKSLIKLTL